MPCIKTNLQTTDIFKQNQPLAFIKYARSAHQLIANRIALLSVVALFAACGSKPLPPHTPASPPTPASAPVFTPQPAPSAASASRLPPVASWADYRRRAAQMIIATNPGASFTGPAPAQWSGIATVTVMLNADGSVRAMDLMRGSRISPEVNDLAMAAARRAANYGPVSNLPQPWQFNETFLYNDNNKFQLVTVVEGR